MSEKIFDQITCDTNFKHNFSKNKNIKVDKIYIKNKPYVIKKENVFDKNILKEFLFYKNYTDKIKKDKMNKTLNVPIKMLNCESDSKMYVFNYIDSDYTKEYVELNIKLYNQWIDYTIQLCLNIYYLNHELGVYHNDLCYKGNFRNVMIKYNDKPFNISVDSFNYQINNNYIVIIDFGHQSKNLGLRTYQFYHNEYKKNKRDYKYESEVFIVFYCSYIFFFKIKDEWIENFDDIYDKFVNEAESEYSNKKINTKDFDFYIIKSLLKLQSENNKLDS